MAACTDALTCAYLSGAAYQNHKTPPEILQLKDWRRIDCERTGMHAIAAYRPSDKTAIIAFRGTNDFTDVIANLTVAKQTPIFLEKSIPGARVHAGFLAQHRAAVEPIREFLSNHPDRATVVTTGHSLGAAVATITAVALAEDGESATCIAFGSPRVGNATFARAAKTLVTRFVNGGDPVCNLPTRLRWRHTGRRVKYADGRFKITNGDPWYRIMPPNPFRVGDHTMQGYALVIDKFMNQTVT